MDEQRWKGNVNDNENTNSWPNETRSRHRNWSAAALGPGPTNLHQPLELSARSSADSTVAALASSLGNGDFKPSEGGFGGITELWINERGQGAATTAAQAGAERSLLCGAHCSIPEPELKVALGTWPEHSNLGFGAGSSCVPGAPAALPMTRHLAAM
ncbi:hypothetical protein FAGAP_11781 [Fusarium agapanthi]|uniref:Uncharacterized protein n=2 Tax=Fusarium fujikuroi species complex TaxID=171627 RepID=A0A9P5AZ94_9HYPO|nr:hypothetical protein FAGAP_11781 [Fusarium agapanthi]